MFNLEDYKKDVEGKLPKRQGGKRTSKVEVAMVEIVKTLVAANEPATIKVLAEKLGKKPQQIHQVLKKSTVLRKEKIKGTTIVIPVESAPAEGPAANTSETPTE